MQLFHHIRHHIYKYNAPRSSIQCAITGVGVAGKRAVSDHEWLDFGDAIMVTRRLHGPTSVDDVAVAARPFEAPAWKVCHPFLSGLCTLCLYGVSCREGCLHAHTRPLYSCEVHPVGVWRVLQGGLAACHI
jgi:hypothetical protein